MENAFLFHAFDIDWTIQRVLYASGVFFLVFGAGIPGSYVLYRSGQTRALDASELETLGRSPDPNQIRMHWKGAQGGKIEASASIDTLRRAAKRGDWLLFFAWPCFISSLGLAFGLPIVGYALEERESMVPMFIVASLCIVPFVGIGTFMAWAALYTNIDLDVDEPEIEAPAEPGAEGG